MGKLTHPIVPITTAATETLSGDYQLWTLENPDTNTQAVFYNVNATATTTATQSVPVRVGQKAYFFVNIHENPNGVSLIAVTGAQTVNLTKETFRTRLGYQIAVFAAGVASSVANFWTPVAGSATQVELVGSYVEARADTVRNKTAATPVTVTGQTTEGVLIGYGAAPAASTVILGPTVNDRLAFGANSFSLSLAGITRPFSVDNTTAAIKNGEIVVLYNGDGTDPRHTLTATGQVLHTPVAGGNINSTFVEFEFPINNGSVVNVGNMVEFTPNTNNRVQPTAISSTNLVAGIAITGGTGNVGGSVFSRVAVYGYYAQTLVADTGGVTAGQFVLPGTTTAGRVISAAAPAAGTFGICMLTAIAGAVTDVFLTGPRT